MLEKSKRIIRWKPTNKSNFVLLLGWPSNKTLENPKHPRGKWFSVTGDNGSNNWSRRLESVYSISSSRNKPKGLSHVLKKKKIMFQIEYLPKKPYWARATMYWVLRLIALNELGR